MKKFKFTVLIIIIVIVLITILQNLQEVNLQFLFFWSFQISKALLIIITAIAGYILGLLSVWLLKKKKK